VRSFLGATLVVIVDPPWLALTAPAPEVAVNSLTFQIACVKTQQIDTTVAVQVVASPNQGPVYSSCNGGDR